MKMVWRTENWQQLLQKPHHTIWALLTSIFIIIRIEFDWFRCMGQQPSITPIKPKLTGWILCNYFSVMSVLGVRIKRIGLPWPAACKVQSTSFVLKQQYSSSCVGDLKIYVTWMVIHDQLHAIRHHDMCPNAVPKILINLEVVNYSGTADFFEVGEIRFLWLHLDQLHAVLQCFWRDAVDGGSLRQPQVHVRWAQVADMEPTTHL